MLRIVRLVLLTLFALLISFVAYFTWQAWEKILVSSENIPTPTRLVILPNPPTLTLTPIPTSLTGKATVSPTTAPVLATSTPLSIPTPLPTTPSPGITPSPEPIPSPTTPAPVLGTVIPANLNVRQGPSVNYLIVGGLVQGDEVTVLRRTPAGADVGDWLEIEMPNKKIGWVVARYIEMSGENILPTATVGPTPTPRPTITMSGKLLNLKQELDVEGGSVSGEIGPHQDQWYTFFEEDVETVIIFIFKPNVNLYSTNFRAYEMQFFLHDENQVPFWPPTDAGALEEMNIGAGSYEGDRDNDYKTGELVWRGGPLIREVRYYLRFVNRSSQPIRYCLIPRDVREWTCSED